MQAINILEMGQRCSWYLQKDNILNFISYFDLNLGLSE